MANEAMLATIVRREWRGRKSAEGAPPVSPAARAHSRPLRRHRGTVHAETARALHAAVGRRTRDSSDQPHSIALPLLLGLVFAARMPPTIAAGRRAAPPAVKQLRRVFSADAREARCSSKGTADSLCHHCPVIGTPARRSPRLKKIHLA
jgi:hypothetical protein